MAIALSLGVPEPEPMLLHDNLVTDDVAVLSGDPQPLVISPETGVREACDLIIAAADAGVDAGPAVVIDVRTADDDRRTAEEGGHHAVEDDEDHFDEQIGLVIAALHATAAALSGFPVEAAWRADGEVSAERLRGLRPQAQDAVRSIVRHALASPGQTTAMHTALDELLGDGSGTINSP